MVGIAFAAESAVQRVAEQAQHTVYDWHLPLLVGLAVGICGAVIVIGLMIKNGVLTLCNSNGYKLNGSSCALSPSQCPEHKAEQERSMRNQESIEKLWKEYGLLRGKIEEGLAVVQRGQMQILLGLVQAGVIKNLPPQNVD